MDFLIGIYTGISLFILVINCFFAVLGNATIDQFVTEGLLPSVFWPIYLIIWIFGK